MSKDVHRNEDHSLHNCKALIFCCMDWRLHPHLEEYFSKSFRRFDICSEAGSVKDFSNPAVSEYLLRQIDLSRTLHNTHTVVLTIHSDCGAYGGLARFKSKEEEFSHHQQELKKAANAIKQRFSDIEVQCFFVDLENKSGEWRAEFRKIKI